MGLPGHSQGRSGLPVSAKVGSRGGSAPKGACSAGVSSGLEGEGVLCHHRDPCWALGS